MYTNQELADALAKVTAALRWTLPQLPDDPCPDYCEAQDEAQDALDTAEEMIENLTRDQQMRKAAENIAHALATLREHTDNGPKAKDAIDRLRNALAVPHYARHLADAFTARNPYNHSTHNAESFNAEYDRNEWQKYDNEEWHDADARDRHLNR